MPGSFAKMWNATSVVLSIAPVVFLCCLAAMRESGYTHTCKAYKGYEYPECAYDMFGFDIVSGVSVSDYISTAQGSGAMAATFFWPLMHLWLPDRQVDNSVAYGSLMFFTLFWSGFLACPVTLNATLHLTFVGLMAGAGVVHYMAMLSHSRKSGVRGWEVAACAILTCVGALSFAGLGLIVLLTFIFRFPVGHYAPYAFYICEVMGLSGLALFPIFWERFVSISGVNRPLGEIDDAGPLVEK